MNGEGADLPRVDELPPDPGVTSQVPPLPSPEHEGEAVIFTTTVVALLDVLHSHPGDAPVSGTLFIGGKAVAL